MALTSLRRETRKLSEKKATVGPLETEMSNEGRDHRGTDRSPTNRKLSGSETRKEVS